MGGPGSGSWYRWQSKKSTVEESLAIGMKDMRKRLYAGASGSFSWTWASGSKASIGYFVTGTHDELGITLHYRWNDKEDVNIPIRLTATPTRFGRPRLWFSCPLIVRGIACGRRAGKLYLPPGAKYFGCRSCHNLTYRSAQEAHQTERLFGRLGFGPDAARAWEHMYRRK